jgi:ADP-heptose:LPS heptosyltransferase
MDWDRAHRILLCLRYGIGDVVMETPVLTALRRAAPAARIIALGAPPAVELLQGDPRVDEVVGIDRWGVSHRWDEGTPAARRAIATWVADQGFDLYLDVHHAAVAVSRAIWERGIRSLEADEGAEEAAVAAGGDAIAAIKAAVRKGWGLDVAPELQTELHITDDDRRAAQALLDGIGNDGAAPVAISPVASLPMKRWPAERFAAAADWVVEATGRTPLLLCDPRGEAGDRVLGAMRHPERVVRIGAPDLRKAAAILARCALFLCNDTGLLHIAAAVGTPVIGVFGPTIPWIYRPPVPHAVGLVGRDIVCPYRNTASLQPPGCWNSDRCLIAEESCIGRVSVRAVVAAMRRVLAPGKRAEPGRAGAGGERSGAVGLDPGDA